MLDLDDTSDIILTTDPEVIEVTEDVTSAVQALVQAEAAIDTARSWAIRPYNTEVIPGFYSALSYATLAKSYLDKFEEEKASLEFNTTQLLTTIAFVKRLGNEAQGVAIEPGIYSAKHYALTAYDIKQEAYGYLDRIGQMDVAISDKKTEIDGLATLSRRWATEETDVPVTPGLFSARHYAIKAETSYQNFFAITDDVSNKITGLNTTITQIQAQAVAINNTIDTLNTLATQANNAANTAVGAKDAANTSANNAKTSENNAKTSENNAKTSETNAAKSAQDAQTYASAVDPVVNQQLQTAMYLFNALNYV